MNKDIENFLSGHRIAVLGASQSGNKVGNSIVRDLSKKGYSVFLVHPSASEIDGRKCFASLSELRGQVDGVVLCIPPEKARTAVIDAADAGITRLWLQEGTVSPEVLAAAYTRGMSVVVNRCIMVYASQVLTTREYYK
jgi:predicted CoA-binding protein